MQARHVTGHNHPSLDRARFESRWIVWIHFQLEPLAPYSQHHQREIAAQHRGGGHVRGDIRPSIRYFVMFPHKPPAAGDTLPAFE